jgi:hypothetical protein
MKKDQMKSTPDTNAAAVAGPPFLCRVMNEQTENSRPNELKRLCAGKG